jgi:hypothetical protein
MYVCPFFFSSLFFFNFLYFLLALDTTSIQLACAYYLFDAYLPADPQNYDYGQ